MCEDGVVLTSFGEFHSFMRQPVAVFVQKRGGKGMAMEAWFLQAGVSIELG